MIFSLPGGVMNKKKQILLKIITAVCVLLTCLNSYANKNFGLTTDSIKSVQQFMKEGVTKCDSGFINIYEKESQVFMEIPEDILNRDILTTITILKGAQNNNRRLDKKFGYGGDAMHEKLVRFVKNNDVVNLVQPIIRYTENDSAVYKKYYQSLINPTIQSFPVVACSDSSFLIDITNYYLGDSELFSLQGAKTELELGAYRQQESWSTEIVSYPSNINFRSTRTYMATNPKNSTYPKVRWEIGSSWFLLPKEPMKPRLADKRVGYFNTTIRGQLKDKYNNDIFELANRWRIEPKPEDIDKYNAGELVEPVKPIVFYVDKNMPSYLVDGVIEAVDSWQKAFEGAGFKNAIYALPEPTKEENPDFSEDDARYSIISYKAAPVPNAYGPQVVDPRSGEVINSHVAVFHSVMDLIQMWYFAMCSPTDPAARIYPVKPELMNKLVHTVVKHEIGHTLGLRHNFMGSTIYPTDSLRSNSFIHTHGLGASIMDYQRFNYIAQPGDHITQNNHFPRIGVYDKFAIQWGYRYLNQDSTPSFNAAFLNAWVNEELKGGDLKYVVETTKNDPRVQSEDSSSDIIYASELGMKNLKYILQNLENWTNEQSDQDYVLLRRRYLYVLTQYQTYIEHVLRFVGSYYTDNALCAHGNHIDVYKATTFEEEKRALEFLNTYYFQKPEWLLSPSFISKLDFDLSERVYGPMFTIFGRIVVSSMLYSTSESVDSKSMRYEEMQGFMFQYLFQNYDTDDSLSEYVRVQQSNFLSQLTINVENTGNIPFNISQLLRSQIFKIKDFALKHYDSKDKLTQNHYKGLINFIKMWEQGNQQL